MTDRIWKLISLFPVAFRRTVASLLTVASPNAINRALGPLQTFLPAKQRLMNWGDKIHKGANVLPSRTSAELYLGLVSHWNNPSGLIKRSKEPDSVWTFLASHGTGLSDVERMMEIDLMSYLPDDILCRSIVRQ